MKRRAVWLLLPFSVLGVDYASKVMVSSRFQLHESKTVIDGFFNLLLVHNRGAIFGMLSGAPAWLRTVLFGLAGIGALVYFGYEFLKRDTPPLQRISLGLILGGAMGNGLDRCLHGYVVDFLDFVFWGHRYPTFNLADSAIVCGAILMGWQLIKSWRQATWQAEEE